LGNQKRSKAKKKNGEQMGRKRLQRKIIVKNLKKGGVLQKGMTKIRGEGKREIHPSRGGSEVHKFKEVRY